MKSLPWSTIAIVVGVLAFLNPNVGFLVGLPMILGAVACKSLKNRRRGTSPSNKGQIALECGALALSIIIAVLVALRLPPAQGEALMKKAAITLFIQLLAIAAYLRLHFTYIPEEKS